MKNVIVLLYLHFYLFISIRMRVKTIRVHCNVTKFAHLRVIKFGLSSKKDHKRCSRVILETKKRFALDDTYPCIEKLALAQNMQQWSETVCVKICP